MSFVRQFAQVVHYNLSKYVASKNGVAEAIKGKANKWIFGGRDGTVESVPDINILINKAGTLKPDDLPAFLVEMAEHADRCVRESSDKSTAAIALYTMLSYAKIKANFSPFHPEVLQFRVAIQDYIISVLKLKSGPSTEQLRKRLRKIQVYLGLLSNDEKVIAAEDLLQCFPQVVTDKNGTRTAYTYLSNEPMRIKYENKRVPPTDTRLPIMLQTDYLWFSREGFDSSIDAMEELEREARVHSLKDQQDTLNTTQRVLAQTTEALLKLTRDPSVATDQKVNSDAKTEARITAENAALILSWQAKMQQAEMKHIEEFKALAKKIDDIELANRKILEAELARSKSQANVPDAKSIEQLKDAIVDERNKYEQVILTLQTALDTAKKSNTPDNQLITQFKTEGAAEAKKTYDAALAKLTAEHEAVRAADAKTAETQKNAAVLAEQKKYEAVIATLKSEHAAALAAKNSRIAQLETADHKRENTPKKKKQTEDNGSNWGPGLLAPKGGTPPAAPPTSATSTDVNSASQTPNTLASTPKATAKSS